MNHPSQPKEKNEHQPRQVERANDSHPDITTTGDFSPGIVKGNFVVNQTIVGQQKESKRKQWRQLDEATFSLLSDSESSRASFFSSLQFTLVEMFGERPYTEFFILVNSDEVQVQGQTVLVRRVIAYQPSFALKAQKTYRRLLENIFGHATSDGKKSLEQLLGDHKKLLGEWTTFLDAPITPVWTPIQCICDSIAKHLEFRQFNNFSLDPADYADHVETSKELMCFIGSFFNIKGMAYAGNLGWAHNNYALMKLTFDMLEKHIKFPNIRVNIEDPNEWDYINGELDEEIRIFQKKN